MFSSTVCIGLWTHDVIVVTKKEKANKKCKNHCSKNDKFLLITRLAFLWIYSFLYQLKLLGLCWHRLVKVELWKYDEKLPSLDCERLSSHVGLVLGDCLLNANILHTFKKSATVWNHVSYWLSVKLKFHRQLIRSSSLIRIQKF